MMYNIKLKIAVKLIVHYYLNTSELLENVYFNATEHYKEHKIHYRKREINREVQELINKIKKSYQGNIARFLYSLFGFDTPAHLLPIRYINGYIYFSMQMTYTYKKDIRTILQDFYTLFGLDVVPLYAYYMSSYSLTIYEETIIVHVKADIRTAVSLSVHLGYKMNLKEAVDNIERNCSLLEGCSSTIQLYRPTSKDSVSFSVELKKRIEEELDYFNATNTKGQTKQLHFYGSIVTSKTKKEN